MDFIQAVKAMKEGKKVRRPDYGEGAYKVKRGNFIGYQNESGTTPLFSFDDYEATDWEVVEKKTLGDKIVDRESSFYTPYYWASDVKEAIKEFVDEAIDGVNTERINRKAREIFGEKLTQ